MKKSMIIIIIIMADEKLWKGEKEDEGEKNMNIMWNDGGKEETLQCIYLYVVSVNVWIV